MIALAEIQALPLHEKLRMMEVLWDGIAPQETELEVPQWHKDILDQRERLIRAGEAQFVDWEIAKQEIRNVLA